MNNPFVIEIGSILTEKECKDLIERVGTWTYVDRGIANYHRATFTDERFSRMLFDRIAHLVPPYFKGKRVVGLNPMFRMSKYDDGGRFEIHKDRINVDTHGNRACMTLNIFLNVPEKGGGTLFYDENKTLWKNVRPQTGKGALFDNQVYHEGEKVEKGPKYLLRTDMMSSVI